MAEPIVLAKDGKMLVVNAPSYAVQLVGEGWQRVPGNVTIVTEGAGTMPDSVVVTEPPTVQPPAPLEPDPRPVGRPRKG